MTIDKDLQYSIVINMKTSQFQKNKETALKKKAILLYRQGLPTREVGKVVGRSHTWVWKIIRAVENSHVDKV